MARVVHTGDPVESLRIEEPISGAVVQLAPGRGGMVTRFAIRDAPILFLDEATLRDPQKNVRGGIPILFPIAGKLPEDRYDAGGAPRTMKQHGFARNLPWAVVDQRPEEASVTLGLEASEETAVVYPFEFALRFTYRLLGPTLEIVREVSNRGDEPMPIQPGLHPYFFVPQEDKAGARVETDAKRRRDNQTGAERSLHEEPPRFGGDEIDWALLGRSSSTVTLRRPPLASIELAFDPSDEVVVVWTLPGRDFVCVEPWRAPGGALARGTAPFIAPGASERTTLRIGLSAAAD